MFRIKLPDSPVDTCLNNIKVAKENGKESTKCFLVLEDHIKAIKEVSKSMEETKCLAITSAPTREGYAVYFEKCWKVIL
jgi:asparagine synthetase B (glutamine-hydrolysing)